MIDKIFSFMLWTKAMRGKNDLKLRFFHPIGFIFLFLFVFWAPIYCMFSRHTLQKAYMEGIRDTVGW